MESRGKTDSCDAIAARFTAAEFDLVDRVVFGADDGEVEGHFADLWELEVRARAPGARSRAARGGPGKCGGSRVDGGREVGHRTIIIIAYYHSNYEQRNNGVRTTHPGYEGGEESTGGEEEIAGERETGRNWGAVRGW